MIQLSTTYSSDSKKKDLQSEDTQYQLPSNIPNGEKTQINQTIKQTIKKEKKNTLK